MATSRKQKTLSKLGDGISNDRHQLTGNATSPIQKLSLDVLFLIFTAASEKDGMAPLSIRAVCQTWRRAVTLTPRAWMNVHGLLGAEEMELYVKQSGTILLNVSLPKCFQRDISPISSRIRHLTAFSMPSGRLVFPNLVDLRILADQNTDLCNLDKWCGITCSNFSLLSHLEIQSQGAFMDHFPIFRPSTFPPLKSLHLYFNPAYPTWLVMLRWFSDSLTSLSVHCKPRCLPPQPSQYWPSEARKAYDQVHFPYLRRLKLSMASTMPLELKTPLLRVYCNCAPGRKKEDSMGHKDIGSVDSMWIDMIPSLPRINQLQILWILIPFDTHPTLLHQLTDDDTLCPHLEVVELHGPCESSEILSKKQRIVEKWLKENKHTQHFRLLVISGEWGWDERS